MLVGTKIGRGIWPSVEPTTFGGVGQKSETNASPRDWPGWATTEPDGITPSAPSGIGAGRTLDALMRIVPLPSSTSTVMLGSRAHGVPDMSAIQNAAATLPAAPCTPSR